MRIIDYFDKGAAKNRAGLCLADPDQHITYAQAQAVSHQIANGLLAHGIGPGARISVLTRNTCDAGLALIGIFRAACVWVSVDPRDILENNAYVIETTGVTAIFYSKEFRQKMLSIRQRCGNVVLAVCIDGDETDDCTLATLIAGQDEISSQPTGKLSDLATLSSTSGTTGPPKIVAKSTAAWQLMILSRTAQLKNDENVRLFTTPLTHGFNAGPLLVALSTGSASILLPDFNPYRVLEAIQRYRVTNLVLPPSAIYQLTSIPDIADFDLTSVRHLHYAGAPISTSKLVRAIEIFGNVFAQSYGQTECGTITFLSEEDHAKALASGRMDILRSCGREIAMTRVEIMDETGKILLPNEVGEVVCKSATLMDEYLGDPVKTAHTNRFGWHHTGDVGYKDDEGYLFLIDRLDDMIITNGINVFPAKVEDILMSHPNVQHCAVVGLPDSARGEKILAVVEEVSRGVLGAQEIKDWCMGKLNPVAIPAAIEFGVLPKSSTGKILRREVRDRYWTGERKI